MFSSHATQASLSEIMQLARLPEGLKHTQRFVIFPQRYPTYDSQFLEQVLY